jgi:hypothetical protein
MYILCLPYTLFVCCIDNPSYGHFSHILEQNKFKKMSTEGYTHARKQ